MDNPLGKILPVNERSDGVYITISRKIAGKISAQILIELLERAKVTNYVAGEIADVVKRARGAPEKIGPLFEYFNPKIEQFITCAITDSKATIQIDSACLASGVTPTKTMLIYFLKHKGVTFGLIEEALQAAVSTDHFDQEIDVAQGTNPVNGKDARIEYDVQIEKDLRPQLQRNGRVDFRKVRTFVEVSAGQVMASKIPATPGTPGRKVTGEEIPATPGKDYDLPKGKNTEIKDKGLALVAAKKGIVKPEGSSLSVSELMVITHDIDYSVGNVKFSGDLIIKGNVKPGFTIETEGDIEVEGQVEGATLKSRHGSISIKKGILGKSNTFVAAKSKIYALFAQDATIDTEGPLVIDRHCLNCTCTCKTFEAVQPESNIVGGTIKASEYIHATIIGNAVGADTTVGLFDMKKGKAKERLKLYGELRAQILEKLEPVKKQLSSKAAIFKQAGPQVSDRQKAELKKWVDSYNILNMKLTHIKDKMKAEATIIQSNALYDGHVKILATIYPGAMLDLYGKEMAIQQIMNSETFQIDETGEISNNG